MGEPLDTQGQQRDFSNATLFAPSQERPMRHVTTIATTAIVTAIICSWGTTKIVANSAKSASVTSVRVVSQVRSEPVSPREAGTTEEMQAETSWARWPSVTDF
jgi:hypothetical protein